jgi:nucleoside-diphosphate-sugar epimerase
MAYVENVAAAHLQAETSLSTSVAATGKAYFINEQQAVNLWDWINELLLRCGMRPVTRSISRNTATQLGRLCETAWRLLRLNGEPPMTRFVAAQLAGSHSYSIAAAEHDFGYRPLFSVEEGLHRLQPDLNRLARPSAAT